MLHPALTQKLPHAVKEAAVIAGHNADQSVRAAFQAEAFGWNTIGVREFQMRLFAGVEAAAGRLMRAKILNMPVLSSWNALLDYCQTVMALTACVPPFWLKVLPFRK